MTDDETAEAVAKVERLAAGLKPLTPELTPQKLLNVMYDIAEATKNINKELKKAEDEIYRLKQLKKQDRC